MALEVLNAFDKVPDRNAVTILLLGSQGVGKQRLAKAIIDIETPFSVFIRTSTNLPLPKETESERPRIDFICFMIDLTNKESVKVIESCLQLVDIEYFLGRSCLVACQVEDTIKNIVDIEQVDDLAVRYNVQALYTQSKEKAKMSAIASRILQLAQVATCFKNHVTPAVIETTKQYGFSSLT